MSVTSRQLKAFFKNKKILVTGGTGSIGSVIVSSLLQYHPKQVIVLNKDDSKQYLMQQEYTDHNHVHFFLGDIRDEESVDYITRNVDIIFHTAALKQVPVCEDHPFEAVKTNILGSENIIRSSIFNRVSRVINVSTDKAVNPTNIMGSTKLISEKLFKSANSLLNNNHTRFASVRFGNVLGSRGSVIPLFLEQAKSGGPLTVTDPQMTRFFMTIFEAVQLTLKAAYYCKGGETFIFKMKSLQIKDLVEGVKWYCQVHDIPIPAIKHIGTRPGEKLYEELIYANELDFVVEDHELYVVLSSDINRPYLHFQPSSISRYHSNQIDPISLSELKNILNQEETKSSRGSMD